MANEKPTDEEQAWLEQKLEQTADEAVADAHDPSALRGLGNFHAQTPRRRVHRLDRRGGALLAVLPSLVPFHR